VLSGDQAVCMRFVVASTTTETLVAQDVVNPTPLVWIPKLRGLVRSSGWLGQSREQRRTGDCRWHFKSTPDCTALSTGALLAGVEDR
jgi:hypothetical protein